MALGGFLTLKGEQSGDIKGSVIQKGREGSILVIAASHEVRAPRDVATGQSTGKRQHGPILITKEVDKSSPPLRTSLATKESLSMWELLLWRPATRSAGGGTEQQFFTIKLTKAVVVSIAFRLPNIKDPALVKLEPYEEVGFTFDAIEWIWTDGGITATDNWSGRT